MPQKWLLLSMAALTASLSPQRRALRTAKRRRVPALFARSDAQLKKGIADFYDESSGIWENASRRAGAKNQLGIAQAQAQHHHYSQVWGEHMHHGFYAPREKAGSFARHLEAQDDMIERSLDLCGASEVAERCAMLGRPMKAAGGVPRRRAFLGGRRGSS